METTTTTAPSPASVAYAAWREASQARTAFHQANERNWTDEVNTTYWEMSEHTDNLWHTYLSIRTGKSVSEVSASINEAIHSARD
jgi:uncharacterized protein YfaS (alpha-2-macroglobulin family)